MMRTIRLHYWLAMITACSAAGAWASHTALHVSGFGTLGAVWLDEHAVYFNHPAKTRERARRPDFGADSLVGVQASLELPRRTDFTLQLIAAEDVHGRYTPRVSWAYLRHNLSPGLTARAGRLRAPFFMLSDGLNVNYAHPWVRPPVEVYGLNPFNDANGIDLIYQHRIGSADVELQPYYLDRSKMRFPDGEAHLRRYLGLSVTVAQGDLSVQFGHGAGRLAVDYGDPLHAFVRDRLLAAGLPREAARMAGRRGHARFDSIGFQWDDGTHQLIGEYARRTATRYITNSHGWHLTAARRIGAFAPFVTFARQSADRPVLRRTLDVPALGTYLDSRSQAQRSLTLGVRWDPQPGTALKAQWTRNRIERDAWGAFFPRGTPLAGSPAGRRVDMLSLSVDFVF